jgi:hypothetical protein
LAMAFAWLGVVFASQLRIAMFGLCICGAVMGHPQLWRGSIAPAAPRGQISSAKS